MIRKVIIVLLSLAAIGIVLGSSSGRLRWRIWDIDGRHAVGIRLTLQELVLMCLVVEDPSKPDIRRSWLGCGFLRGRMFSQPANTYSRTTYAVYLPSWAGVVLFGAYPTIAFIRGPVRRWRRRKRGLCARCGYDLTGLTEPRCPECGTPFDLPAPVDRVSGN